jgi:hypothetical protein
MMTEEMHHIIPDPQTETDNMALTVEQLRKSGPLPHVPLVVITAASRGSGLPQVFSPENRARLTEAAMAMQKKLVDLIPGGEQILVDEAGHNVHLDKPEAVLDPIRSMIARVRKHPSTSVGPVEVRMQILFGDEAEGLTVDRLDRSGSEFPMERDRQDLGRTAIHLPF